MFIDLTGHGRGDLLNASEDQSSLQLDVIFSSRKSQIYRVAEPNRFVIYNVNLQCIAKKHPSKEAWFSTAEDGGVILMGFPGASRADVNEVIWNTSIRDFKTNDCYFSRLIVGLNSMALAFYCRVCQQMIDATA